MRTTFFVSGAPQRETRQQNRRSLRLRDYDYSQAGAYFLTICTRDRNCWFGHIQSNVMRLNDIGRFVHRCWEEIPTHFPNAELDEFVVMPNHIHGIVVIGDAEGAKDFSPLQTRTARLPQNDRSPQSALPNGQPRGTSRTVGSVVRGFKIGVTKWVRSNTPITDVWQRNYWERVVRSETELHQTREYIQNNPAQWELDRFNPARAEGGPSAPGAELC